MGCSDSNKLPQSDTKGNYNDIQSNLQIMKPHQNIKKSK